MKIIVKSLLFPIRKSLLSFLFFGIILFVPELFTLLSYERAEYVATHAFTTLAFSFAVSYCLCLPSVFLSKCGTIIERAYLILIHILLYVISFADVILFKFFRLRCDETALELLLQTNGGEVGEFLKIYFSDISVWLYLCLFIALLILEIICYIFRKQFVQILSFVKHDGWLILFLLIGFVNLSIFFIFSSSPNPIRTHTSSNPMLENHILWSMKNGLSALDDMEIDIDRLENALNDLRLDVKSTIVPDSLFEDLPSDIVLLIGETYNRNHSSLYGYSLNTTPRQFDYYPYVFSNVISASQSTIDAFKAILSLNSAHDKWSEAPLFPAIFKQSGWNVNFYSNQFVKGLNKDMLDFNIDAILNRPVVDDKCFSYHNAIKFQYDGEFVDYVLENIFLEKEKNITIVHFMGQHPEYSARYPFADSVFSLDDYKNRTELGEDKKSIVMHYDNAIHYNDSQIGKILDFFRDRNAIVIAISDHSEAVCDFDPRFGRYYFSKDNNPFIIKSQVDIPFLVFVSEKYRRLHPQTISRIEDSIKVPFMTDDISHLLLYLGNIKSDWFDSSKCLLHPNYNKFKHRILLCNDVDYDEKCNIPYQIGF